jgi:hypothetical protein
MYKKTQNNKKKYLIGALNAKTFNKQTTTAIKLLTTYLHLFQKFQILAMVKEIV